MALGAQRLAVAAPAQIYTLSLHDALPILYCHGDNLDGHGLFASALNPPPANFEDPGTIAMLQESDRKSTRLNSSHANISYAVFCLNKKTPQKALGHYVGKHSKMDMQIVAV